MRVGEPQHQDVLHRLLAEVVVDAVDLGASLKTPMDLFVQLVARGEVGTEGFFDRLAAARPGLRGPGPPRRAGDGRPVQLRRDREVIDARSTRRPFHAGKEVAASGGKSSAWPTSPG